MAAERRRMRLVYADTIKDLLANCVIQDGERHGWGGQLVSYMLLSVWASRWAEKGRKSPWDIHPMMASGLDNPLASRSLSGEKGAFGPLTQFLGAVTHGKQFVIH